MTKEQYIMTKTYNPLDIVYHYYVSHPMRNHPPIAPQQLFQTLQNRGWDVNKIAREVMEEYDKKYNIVVLLDNRGNFIKYV